MIVSLESVSIGRNFRMLLNQMFVVQRIDKESICFSQHYKEFVLLEKEKENFVVSAKQYSYWDDKVMDKAVVLHISNKSKDIKVELL